MVRRIHQNKAQRDTFGKLSHRQILALACLVRGGTDAEAAEVAGVHRKTVNGWRHHDADFKSAITQARLALWDSAADYLRSAARRAAEVLVGCLDNEDPAIQVRSAVALLKAAGLDGLRPAGAEGIAPGSLGCVAFAVPVFGNEASVMCGGDDDEELEDAIALGLTPLPVFGATDPMGHIGEADPDDTDDDEDPPHVTGTEGLE